MGSVRFLVLLVGSLGLAGCSIVTGLFPDKQKQYQYTSEIPALEVPPDLSMSTISGAKWNRAAPEQQQSATAGDGATSAAGPAALRRATLAQNTEDVPLIEVAAAFPEAWNDVGRALGRMKVEVSDQNRSDGVYYIYYGGSARKHEDKGVWGDIADLFSGGDDGAREYRLKLEEHKTAQRVSTDVFLFDSDGEPIRQGPALNLLKQLHREIQGLSSDREETGEASDETVKSTP